MRDVVGKLLTLLTLGCLCAPAWAQGPQTRPVFSKERSFRIPFDVDPAQGARIKEVQLAVSTDRGANWRPAGQAPAPKAREFFTFTAPGDGEYWFTVRTVDVEDRADPPTFSGASPQLVVVVDTTPPTAELRGLNPTGDEVGIEWNLNDLHLDLASLRIEFRAGSTDWLPIQVPASAQGRSKFRPGGKGPIELRLRVLDRAGNETVQQVALYPTYGPSATTAAQGLPGSGSGGPNVGPGVPAFGSAAPLPSTFQPADQPYTVPPPPNPQSSFGSTVPGSSAGPTLPLLSNTPTMRNPTSSTGSFGDAGRPVNETGSSPPSQLVSMPTPPPVRTNLQLVNSTRFSINYEVAEIGRSGLGTVALYWTYDGGAWNYHGDDEDRESPFKVEVDGEGTFGFKLVARSNAGLGDDPPRPGDQADIWIEVDITPPELDLKPPVPGRGASSGVLDVQWQAREKNPAAKPISLFYAEDPGGPWKPMAEGIENSGRFSWPIPADPSMPYKFFVRIECRDRAGNVGRAETPTPVVVDLTRPRLKILRVEPATQSNDLTVLPDP
jgi:hypothetical protein